MPVPGAPLRALAFISLTPLPLCGHRYGAHQKARQLAVRDAKRNARAVGPVRIARSTESLDAAKRAVTGTIYVTEINVLLLLTFCCMRSSCQRFSSSPRLRASALRTMGASSAMLLLGRLARRSQTLEHSRMAQYGLRDCVIHRLTVRYISISSHAVAEDRRSPVED